MNALETADGINKMFDLINIVRETKNEGCENYLQILLKSYPIKYAEENFNYAANKHT